MLNVRHRIIKYLDYFPCFFLYFQAAVIQSAAACRAPRRSCCLRAKAWWETPHATPGATRAMRTWKMVMIASLSLVQHYPTPSGY